MNQEGEPVPLLCHKEGSFVVNDQAVSEILQQSDLLERKVVVISTVGEYRRGKSFLLNFLLRYLKNQGKPDWMNATNDTLEGFSWRRGMTRETDGIVMWSRAYPLGDEYAVILLDTEGTYDEHSTNKTMSHVLACSALISSVQIFNLHEKITKQTMHETQAFAEFGRLASCSKAQQAFQKLIYLVRDWSFDDFDCGFQGGSQYLEHWLQNDDDGVKDMLKNCFSDVKCYLMPYPGDKVKNDKNFAGKISDLNVEFSAHLKQLIEKIFSTEYIQGIEIGGTPLKLKDFMTYFTMFAKTLNASGVEPKSLFQAQVESSNMKAREDAMRLNKEKIEEVEECYDPVHKLDQVYETPDHDTLAQFDNQPKVGGSEHAQSHSESFVLGHQICCFTRLAINQSNELPSIKPDRNIDILQRKTKRPISNKRDCHEAEKEQNMNQTVECKDSYFHSSRILIIIVFCNTLTLPRSLFNFAHYLDKLEKYRLESPDISLVTLKFYEIFSTIYDILLQKKTMERPSKLFQIAKSLKYALESYSQNLCDLYLAIYNHIEYNIVQYFNLSFTVTNNNGDSMKYILNIPAFEKDVPKIHDFKKGINRLFSYNKNEHKNNLDIIQLTKNGLYYMHSFIVCSFCEFKKKIETSNTEEYIRAHQEKYPNCFMFTENAEENVGLELTLDFTFETYRLFSLKLTTWKVRVKFEQLATNGFHWSGCQDATRCAFCNLEVQGWLPEDEIKAQHLHSSPQCSLFVDSLTNGINFKEEKQEHITLIKNLRDIFIIYPQLKEKFMQMLLGKSKTEFIMGQPMYPDVSTIEARIARFSMWPISLGQSPQQLSEAGFFYTGRGDRVICFHCGGGLKDWARTDQPWVEHAAWFPHCQYLIAKKGAYFVQQVQRAIVQNENRAELNIDTTSGKTIRLLSDVPTINARRMAVLKQNSCRVGEEFVCLLCKSESVSAVILPCAHLATCQQCAFKLVDKKSKCPACKTLCMAIFKVYLG